jgi:hypothetical protein
MTPLLLNKLGLLKQKGLDYFEPDERSYGVERKKSKPHEAHYQEFNLFWGKRLCSS